MRTAIRVFFLALIRLFFPSITVEGRERIPVGVPLLFVLNHPNGLLDPVVLRVALRRSIGFLAKSTLFQNPAFRVLIGAFDAIPVYRQKDVGAGGGSTSRNEETFALCRKALARGEALALFPEGVSHADADLKPLKTGAARIALSAVRENDGRLPVMLVPVGLAYADRSVFRSSVLVVLGEPIEVKRYYDDYLRDDHAAVDALTEAIRTRLDEVVLQAETRELLDGVARVAIWTADAPSIRDDASEQVQRTRELLTAYTAWRAADPARVEAIVANARRYTRMLRALGVTDPWALEMGEIRASSAMRVAAELLALFPFAIVGALLGWLPYRLTGIVAARATRDEDVIGTVKLLGGTFILLFAWLIEATIAGFWIGGRAALLVFIAAPITGYAALRFDEIRHAGVEALRHAWFRRRRPEIVARLAERRRELATHIADALREIPTHHA